ncbi:MAG: prolyl oligopeptidase family serine peptidase [Bacteroidota bacterium]
MTSMKRAVVIITVALGAHVGASAIFAQDRPKKLLTHDVYDSWKRATGEAVSPDGAWILYTLEPQEGDARLVVADARSGRTDTIARGVNGSFTFNSDYAVFTVKALYADVKKGKIAKKKGDDLPKDSLGILALGSSSLAKIPRVKSFKLPERGSGWVAYQREKDLAPGDSVKRQKPRGGGDDADEQSDDAKKERGTTVVVRELSSGKEYQFPFARDFEFTKDGSKLIVTTTGNDSTALPGVFVFSTAAHAIDTIASGKGSFRQPAWDEEGTQAAFVADRDTSKARQRYFSLYLWRAGKDSATLVADTTTPGMYPHWLVSENGRLKFSKDGSRLFVGTAPVPLPDDTTMNDEETAKLDIWSWQDHFIQPQQLKMLDEEKKRSHQAVVHLADRGFVQLGDTSLPAIDIGDEGNAELGLGTSDLSYRRSRSWEGYSRYDLFAVDLRSGARRRLVAGVRGPVHLSPGGRYAVWYDTGKRHWFAVPLAGGKPVNLTANVSVPLYNELNDVPDHAAPHGLLGWIGRDSLFLVYDRYDIWVTDPTGTRPAWCMTRGAGRKGNLRYRYVRLDPEERFITAGSRMLLRTFDDMDKRAGFAATEAGTAATPRLLVLTPHDYGTPQKAKQAGTLIFTRSTFRECPDLYTSSMEFSEPKRLSDANPQQDNYLWGSVELVHWKPPKGKELDGLLYTPEGFDVRKKYPMIVYYYERNSDFLHRYFAPAPSASTVNIPLYVSRGYIVFVPDIRYRVGHPGGSALECIVSGVKALIARGFVDPDRIGLQGQSWGGYQTAFLVTRTHMFRAAMAGAVVSNMTSAYGGIRWGTGFVRMFQYEKSQSRIGRTLWERPDLYIENSPLFRADSIRTPLLLMHNDADGAVPWYQGIEMFNALRRLNRPVWMLTYNGEEHNLVQRKNRKDLSVRMLQFFDHYLMEKPAPRWMTEGLPAIEKGKTLKYELSGSPALPRGNHDAP